MADVQETLALLELRTEKFGVGVTPIAPPVVPLTSPGVQDVVDALIALGLVTQSD